MKTFLQLFIAVSISIISQAQTLPGINYQALLRNAEGQPLASQTIIVQVSILHGSETGTPVYTETQNATTNAFGQINLSIGEGESTLGVFGAINWGNGPYFLKTGVDLNQSGTFHELEVVKFYSVPFAKQAERANGIPALNYEERGAIENPYEGMMILNPNTGKLNYFFNNRWYEPDGTINSFYSCGDLLIDYRDGQKYQTVQIGTQCWMQQSLNIGLMINGSNNQTDNGAIEKYCYNNSEAKCTIYGGLYQWDEMMGYTTTAGIQGICPQGWYIPTDAEWTELTSFLGGESVAGGKMKEAGTVHWASPNYGATNSSGFTGLANGYRYINGIFSAMSVVGYWWSSSQYNSNNAWVRNLYFSNPEVERSNHNKEQHGFSVRCIKD